ncbi:hypothetical protein K440DRAFT_41469 [Wilcoxina mikolae CBS 423.85]|nr:hypothetical protein K440DRAFT_41469 [Wilcoxina mikolae CBS 423.85]
MGGHLEVRRFCFLGLVYCSLEYWLDLDGGNPVCLNRSFPLPLTMAWGCPFVALILKAHYLRVEIMWVKIRLKSNWLTRWWWGFQEVRLLCNTEDLQGIS